MCAINGITEKNEPLVRSMNEVTKHRGPDATDVYVDDVITLGHNRLSIIDLDERSHQPMKSTDGRYVIAFNGEIYNFKELKESLAYGFKTESDTEVVLAGFALEGNDFFKKLNGMFACAIWDTQKKELVLARDQSGVKPLYYYKHQNNLIFSSEIKGLLEDNRVPRKLNQKAFSMYLNLLYVPAPFTMFEGIQKFPPGHIGIWKDNELSLTQFKADAQWGQNTKDAVTQGIKRQMISDRPIGVYLSGGIDSSIVAHSVKQKAGSVDTFSIGFELSKGEEVEKFNADFLLARKTAKKIGANHHEVYISSDDLLKEFENCIYHLDEPISNATILPMYMLARYAKEHVTVVLGGEGGDELFGGYERYRLSHIASTYQKVVPGFLRVFLAKVHRKFRALNTLSGMDRFKLFMFQENAALKDIYKKYDAAIAESFLRENYFSNIENDFENQFMSVDERTWLVDEAFMRGDKMSMAHGLEVRVPFMDTSTIAHAHSTPSNEKLSFEDTKMSLKKAFKGVLPDYLFNQPKRGWFSPSAKWLRHPKMHAYAKEVLSESYYEGTKDLCDWMYVQKLLDDHTSKKRYNAVLLWALFTFQIWAKRYTVTQ